MNTIKSLIFVLCTLFIFQLTFSNSQEQLDSLIDSYSYNFSTDEINEVITSSDVIDTNSNSLNDTLQVLVNTENINSNYIVIVTLYDSTPIIQYKNLTSQNLQFNFQTINLQNSQFNYSVEIRDEQFSLLYRKDNIQTQQFSNLETGAIIKNIFQQISTNSIVLNLELENISQLQYNTNMLTTISFNISNEELFIQENISIQNQNQQTIQIEIPQQILKKIRNTQIGNKQVQVSNIFLNSKSFQLNTQLTIPNIDQYITTPYLETIHSKIFTTESKIDNIQITIPIQNINNDEFNVVLAIEDNHSNSISNFSISQQLDSLNNQFRFNISNEELYKSKIDSSLIISNLILRNSTQQIQESISKKIISNQISFVNVTLPNLPDLILELNPQYNEELNQTNVSILVSNQGLKDAYNIEIELFDELLNSTTITIPFIEKQTSKEIFVLFENSTDGILFTSFIDLKNIIDESNESNNIDQQYSLGENSIQLKEKISIISINETHSFLEIKLTNSGKIPLYNLNISALNYSQVISLQSNQSQLLFFEDLTQNLENLTLNISIQSNYVNKNILFSNENVDINISHTILSNNIVEFTVLNNASSIQELIFLNTTLQLQTNNSITFFKEFNQIPNHIEYTQNGNQKTYNISTTIEEENNSNKNISIILLRQENGTYIYELFISNNQSTSNTFEFIFDNEEYRFILDNNSVLRLYVESSNNNPQFSYGINDSASNYATLNSELTTTSSSIYEVFLQNTYNSYKVVSFNLGEYSYSFDLSKDERKVVFLELNQSNLNLQNISIQ